MVDDAMGVSDAPGSPDDDPFPTTSASAPAPVAAAKNPARKLAPVYGRKSSRAYRVTLVDGTTFTFRAQRHEVEPVAVACGPMRVKRRIAPDLQDVVRLERVVAMLDIFAGAATVRAIAISGPVR